MSKPATLSFWKTLRYLGESAAFFPFMTFFRLLGLDAASAVGGFIGRHVFYRLPPARTARENLRASYPEKSDEEVEQIVRQVCDNLGRVVGEYPHLKKLTIGPAGRIEIFGKEFADAALASGKGVMFISGHFANWETMPIAARAVGYDASLVYRPPNNPFVDRWISRQRGSAGPQEHITKSVTGTRRFFTLLKQGKPVLLLVDQKTYQGVPVPFFGRDAMTTAAPASFALKLGSLLLPACAERTKGAHFRVRVYPPVELTPTGDEKRDVLDLTAKITATMEAMVRERPSQWLWIHRRWSKPGEGKRRHARAGSGVRVEREGSSLT
ncbi:MAG: lysophospholipid acyltransferase family protein [Alphaproteobacteria bacterium]|nr:lysophospholipid acyltransferase family protein [Alphaproteobacteria bacterium]